MAGQSLFHELYSGHKLLIVTAFQPIIARFSSLFFFLLH